MRIGKCEFCDMDEIEVKEIEVLDGENFLHCVDEERCLRQIQANEWVEKLSGDLKLIVRKNGSDIDLIAYCTIGLGEYEWTRTDKGKDDLLRILAVQNCSNVPIEFVE